MIPFQPERCPDCKQMNCGYHVHLTKKAALERCKFVVDFTEAGEGRAMWYGVIRKIQGGQAYQYRGYAFPKSGVHRQPYPLTPWHKQNDEAQADLNRLALEMGWVAI